MNWQKLERPLDWVFGVYVLVWFGCWVLNLDLKAMGLWVIVAVVAWRVMRK